MSISVQVMTHGHGTRDTAPTFVFQHERQQWQQKLQQQNSFETSGSLFREIEEVK
jgi:hypothetical protein